MKGSAGVPVLELVTMNKVIQKLDPNPNLFFANMFSSVDYPSDAIEWEIEYGSSGLTPFVAPGAPAPKIGLDGIGSGSAKAAYMKEAIIMDEVFLNNVRKPGTTQEYQMAERNLAKGLRKLRNRTDRRLEWMYAKAVLDGGFSYLAYGGTKVTVSYGIPETHVVALASDRYWTDGASKNVLDDVLTGKQVLADDAGVVPDYAMLNSTLLRLLLMSTDIQNLLKSSAFGNGDLFARPAEVIGDLLGVGPLKVYDAFTETQQMITGAVTAASTTVIPVADATDIPVGATARLYDVSENNVWEDATVESVDIPNSTFTITAVTAKSFKANEDVVRFREKFIADNEFHLFSERNADGEQIAEAMRAPFGLDRNWGVYVDSKPQWDPESIILRIQAKELPAVYHPDCSYKIVTHAL